MLCGVEGGVDATDSRVGFLRGFTGQEGLVEGQGKWGQLGVEGCCEGCAREVIVGAVCEICGETGPGSRLQLQECGTMCLLQNTPFVRAQCEPRSMRRSALEEALRVKRREEPNSGITYEQKSIRRLHSFRDRSWVRKQLKVGA